MEFNSFAYFGFFGIVLFLYSALNHRWQNRLLLAASYFFYGCWNPKFLILISSTTLADYYIGRAIGASDEPIKRKRWLLLSLAMNLGVLGFFKYFNFFIDSAAALLTVLGLAVSPRVLDIALPVGISFITFQEMGYIIDVYRGKIRPVSRLEHFAIFTSFFPQLIAGPIERAGHMLPQIEQPRRMTWVGWCEGATLILLGLFKKIVVADVLGPMVVVTFDNPELCSSGHLLFGLYCFAIQIYADFSAYSDIARGSAQILGFELMQNFNQPYFSTSISEFWRRRHISLSTWLRDYLYVPLGGNRGGSFNTYRNLFITMVLGGFWHGASWNFVIWGALNGFFLGLHKFMLGGRKPSEVSRGDSRLVFFLKMIGTFQIVSLTWVFFRATSSFSQAWTYLKCVFLFGRTSVNAVVLDMDDVGKAVLAIAALLLLIDLPQYLSARENGISDHCVILRWRLPLRAAVLSVFVVWLIMSRGVTSAQFIYFQF